MKLEWTPNQIGDYATASNYAAINKKDGWRLPSVKELQTAGQDKIPGFIEEGYYWSDDWNGDPFRAGAVQMYWGGYFFGMQTYNKCNYRLVREIK
jgi:hypothetical protein